MLGTVFQYILFRNYRSDVLVVLNKSLAEFGPVLPIPRCPVR